MKNYSFMAVSCFFFFLLASSPVLSSEVCSELRGTCRNACGQNEEPELRGLYGKAAMLRCRRGRAGPAAVLCLLVRREEIRRGQLRPAGKQRLPERIGEPRPLLKADILPIRKFSVSCVSTRLHRSYDC